MVDLDSLALTENLLALGLSEEEVNTWLISNDSDSGTALLSKQEIIDHVNGQELQDTEPEPIVDFKPKSITSKSAISCIDILLDFANAYNFSLNLAVLVDFKEQLNVKALNEKKQTLLSSFFKPLTSSEIAEQ